MKSWVGFDKLRGGGDSMGFENIPGGFDRSLVAPDHMRGGIDQVWSGYDQPQRFLQASAVRGHPSARRMRAPWGPSARRAHLRVDVGLHPALPRDASEAGRPRAREGPASAHHGRGGT